MLSPYTKQRLEASIRSGINKYGLEQVVKVVTPQEVVEDLINPTDGVLNYHPKNVELVNDLKANREEAEKIVAALFGFM